MVLQARTTQVFTANVGILDKGVVVETIEVTFNFPRAIDYHISEKGNKLENLYYTYSNMAHRFNKPVQCPLEDGSIINLFTLKEIVDIGYGLDLNEAATKEQESMLAAREEADKLVKKHKLVGNSDKKDTSEDKN